LGSTAINFGADISNLSWYQLYAKGVFGGLNAYYTRQPLYDKINEYAGNETRDLRFFPIQISEAEYARLMLNLDIVGGKPVPYRFFSYNCSHGIYELLFNSLEGLPKQPKQMMTPLDVVDILSKNKRLGMPFILPSLYERVQQTTNDELAELEYLEWVNRQAHTKLNEEREKRLAQLRFSVAQQNTERPDLFSLEQGWRKPHKYSRIELGVLRHGKEYATMVGVRPLLHDQTDNHFFYSGVNSIEIASMFFCIKPEKIDILQVDFFHLRSTPIHDKWFRFNSYDFGVRYNTGGYFSNFGIGKSFSVFAQKGVVLEMLLVDELKKSDIFNNYIGLETHFTKRSEDNYRYGVNYRYLYKGFSYKTDLSLKLWIATDLSKDFSLYLENQWDNKKKGNLKLGLRYYF